MSQTDVTRSKAVKAPKTNDGDLFHALKEIMSVRCYVKMPARIWRQLLD